MLNGSRPGACVKCFNTEDNGGRSKRQEELERWSIYDSPAQKESEQWEEYTVDWARTHTNERGQIERRLAYIELRLGNVCNLKCITCNPNSSNMWQQDYDVVAQKLEFVDQGMTSKNMRHEPNNWTINRRFWNDLLESSWWARKIYINGGEPTHNLEHIWYLEQLAERGLAQNIILWYSTNMTHVPKKMLEAWKHFKKVEISASIDAVDARNEYIRFPSKWSKTIEVLKQFEALPNVDLTVVQTVSAFNFPYLDEFYEWIQTTERKWSLNHVTVPSYLSANIIPQSKRLKLLEVYKEILPPHIHANLNTRYSGEHVNGSTLQFVQFVTEMDNLRGTNIEEIFPELIDLLYE